MLPNAACVMSYANPGDLQLHCHDKGSVTFNWMVKEEFMRIFCVLDLWNECHARLVLYLRTIN